MIRERVQTPSLPDPPSLAPRVLRARRLFQKESAQEVEDEEVGEVDAQTQLRPQRQGNGNPTSEGGSLS